MYRRFYGFRIPTGDSELSRLFCWWNFEVQLVVVSEFHNYIWCEVFVHVEITVGSLWTLGDAYLFFYQGGKNVDTIQTSCSDKWDRPIFLWIQLFMLVCLLQAKLKSVFRVFDSRFLCSGIISLIIVKSRNILNYLIFAVTR